jgi:hypothetical protein
MKMAQPAQAPEDSADNKITINADGTYSPPGGISINNGGVAKFDVTYPTGMNVCSIAIGQITFSYSDSVTGTTGGTVKIGS